MSTLRDDRHDEPTPAIPTDRPRELLVDQDERVVIERFRANDREMTRYRIVTRDEWIENLPENTPESVRRALALAGSWDDVDGDEMAQALWNIRHANPPSPPVEFDDDDFA